MVNELKDNKEIKKYLSKEFSLTFSKLVEQELKNKRSSGISYFEKDIYKKIGISKGAFNFYKNGNDGRGAVAKEKVPDLVGLYKIKNYFNVPYSYLLNETTTKKIDNLQIGATLGLNDESISILKNLNNKSDIYSETKLFILNNIISNDNFIRDLTNIVLQKLSIRAVNEKYKKLNVKYSENSEYMNFRYFKLIKNIDSIIEKTINSDDISNNLLEDLKKRPRNLDTHKIRYLDKRLNELEEEIPNCKNA